jgi:hypothetical protein
MPVNYNAVITAGSSYTALATDLYFFVDKAIGSPTAINLWPTPGSYTELFIKDAKGDAGTNPITLSIAGSTIDGQPTFVLNQNFQGVTLRWNGSSYSVVGIYAPTGVFLLAANDLSDLVSGSAARNNLGLTPGATAAATLGFGSAALKNAAGTGSVIPTVTGSGTITNGDFAKFVDAAGTLADSGTAAP